MPPLSFSEGDNLTKMFPRLTCLITINRGSRNAKDGVFYEKSIKCVSKKVVRIWIWRCSRHFFSIAIDFKQFRATIESKTTYALHTIAYNNRCQTIAIGESIIPYALHTIVDSNRSQTLAAIVFVNCFILEIYTLNGRKVMAYILKKLKKGKFNVFNFCAQNVNT